MLKLLLGILFILSAAGCLEDEGAGGSSSNKAADSYDVSQSSFASNNADWSSTNLDSAADSALAPAPTTGITTYSNPEPSTIILLSIGLGGILAARRKKRQT